MLGGENLEETALAFTPPPPTNECLKMNAHHTLLPGLWETLYPLSFDQLSHLPLWHLINLDPFLWVTVLPAFLRINRDVNVLKLYK